jgi:hypothetical protein
MDDTANERWMMHCSKKFTNFLGAKKHEDNVHKFQRIINPKAAPKIY